MEEFNIQQHVDLRRIDKDKDQHRNCSSRRPIYGETGRGNSPDSVYNILASFNGRPVSRAIRTDTGGTNRADQEHDPSRVPGRNQRNGNGVDEAPTGVTQDELLDRLIIRDAHQVKDLLHVERKQTIPTPLSEESHYGSEHESASHSGVTEHVGPDKCLCFMLALSPLLTSIWADKVSRILR